MSDNKYKMFRNYMVNELGIGRDEIREWTKEAVTEAVEKFIRGQDWESRIHAVCKNIFQDSYNNRRAVENAVTEYLLHSFEISIKAREEKQA